MRQASRLPIRLWAWLGRPATARRATWVVPLLFGVISILLRQDNNWDLRNYHIYNPFAWLNGKIGVDLAPGQWQSYFNPTLDLLYYFLARGLPGPAAGFVMGALHGLNFILVAAIARELLPRQPDAGRLSILLAMAGMLGSGFVSEIGNTMGDNVTALFVSGALLLVLKNWTSPGQRGNDMAMLAAGILAGIGAGLKLTNAVYALALCLALLVAPASPLQRLRIASTFGTGVLLGIGISAGHWYWKMWTVFGNPLFPQFNNIFHAPLAAPLGIGDTHWLPNGWLERLSWPFLFASDPNRVSELKLSLLIWPILYVAFIALSMQAMMRRPRCAPGDSHDVSRLAMVWTFFGASYLIWMNLFSIYRYLVPLELLAPLVLWLIAQRLLPGRRTALVVSAVLVTVIAATFVTSPSWGRAKWAYQSFRADVPAMAHPEQSIVFTVHADPPMGWLAAMFPVKLAFVSLGSGFPESEAFRERIDSMMSARRGPLYVMTKHEHAGTAPAQETNRRRLENARRILANYGLVMVPTSCRSHSAFVGHARFDFQLCQVKRKEPFSPGQEGMRLDER